MNKEYMKCNIIKYFKLIKRNTIYNRFEEKSIDIGISIPGYTFFLNGTNRLDTLEKWQRLIRRQYNKGAYISVYENYNDGNLNRYQIEVEDVFNEMKYRTNNLIEESLDTFLNEQKEVFKHKEINLIPLENCNVIRIIHPLVINHKEYPIDIFKKDIDKILNINI